MAPNKKEIDYPAEIIFKSIFRNREDHSSNLEEILNEYQVEGSISRKPSRNGRFMSYTIQGTFPSDDILNTVCTRISSLSGYMMMF